MKCPNCKKDHPEGIVICDHCGYEFKPIIESNNVIHKPVKNNYEIKIPKWVRCIIFIFIFSTVWFVFFGVCMVIQTITGIPESKMGNYFLILTIISIILFIITIKIDAKRLVKDGKGLLPSMPSPAKLKGFISACLIMAMVGLVRLCTLKPLEKKLLNKRQNKTKVNRDWRSMANRNKKKWREEEKLMKDMMSDSPVVREKATRVL